MSINKHRGVGSGDMAGALHEVGQALNRLVELGESVLDLLEQTSVPLELEAGQALPHAASVRSIRCSVRSANVTQPNVNDLAHEDIISFVQASAMIPTHPSPSTISRWCSPGCRGVKLESTYIGGRRKTTRQAIDRFLTACGERNFAGMDGDIFLLRERVMDIKERLASESKESIRSKRPKRAAKRGKRRS